MSVMKNGIPSRCYYQLLEWKEGDRKTFDKFCAVVEHDKLDDFLVPELKALYLIAFGFSMPKF